MKVVSVDQQSQQPLESFATWLQHESWSRQQIKDYQAQALQDCRAYAYAHSPFYQHFHRGLMDHPLQDLPVLTKAIMTEHFDELVTDPVVHFSDAQQYLSRANAATLFLDHYQTSITSGTTGKPGIFLSDPSEGAILLNSFARSLFWGGATPKSRAAVVTSTVATQMSAQMPVSVNGQEATRLQLSASDPIEILVQRLNEWQPDVLLCYASTAVSLANEEHQGRLHISPHSVFCSAETLTSEMRKRIESAWPTQVFNAYSLTESGILAMECSAHQGMHLFEDSTIIEVVDENNRPVPSGTPGAKVLLTVLFRRTQPLIRYEVTDIVQISTRETCACGRPFALLESVQGRTPDILYLQSPEGKAERVSVYLFLNALDALPVSGWQVVQEPDGLHIFLAGASPELRDEQVREALSQALTKRGVIVPTIETHRVEALMRSASGKISQLISHVPHQAP
jgi:phenylacetate-CoA ligase